MKPFTEKAVHLIRNIPKGKVMTYGQIAKLSGSPRGARQVARLLHSMSSRHGLPWHRVVNAKGEISFTDEEHFEAQKFFLEEEGVEVAGRRIDLKLYQFHPMDSCAE